MSKTLFITPRVVLIAAITFTSSNSWADKWLSINKVTGKGVYEWNDGRRYEGDVVRGKRQGHGVIAFPNGNRFEGEFKNDKASHGRLQEKEGRVVEGNLDSNENFSGKGILVTWPDGTRFETEFANGDPVQGRIQSADGNVYEGGINASWHRNGKGISTWSNGDRFEGMFDDGKMSSGRYQYINGNVYEGGFDANEQYSGNGISTWPNGSRFKGVFDNGKMSNGRLQYADGSVYEGGFDANEQYNGYGKITWSDGGRFEGMWENGKQTYGRTQYTNGIVYEGNYDANGSRSGKGVWIRQNGERIVGEWEKGVLRRRTDDEGGFQWGKLAAIGVGAAIGGAGHLSSEAQTRVVTAAVNDSMAGQQGIGNLQGTTDTLLAEQKAQQARAAQQAREQQAKVMADEAANNERLLKAAREPRQPNAGQQQTVSTDRSWQQQSGTPANYATTSSANGGSSGANSNRSAGTASNADSPKLYTSIVEGSFRGIGTTEAAGCEAAEKDAAQWSPTHLSDKRRLLSRGTCSCNNGYSNAYGKALECLIPYKMEVTSPYSNIQSGSSKGVSK